jgi:hypothetical protein
MAQRKITSSGLDAAVTTDITSSITDGAPGALDTLNELAAALGDDANFATTVANSLATKATLVKSGTEPADKTAGLLWYNTSESALYSADGTEYLKVSAASPTLTGVTGVIYAGAASTLTLSGTNFLTSNLVVTFTFNSTDYDVSVTPSSDTSASVAVPSGLYNVLTGGDNVSITVTNSDNVTSGGQSKTAIGLPSGGTISTFGNYRVHAFTSGGTFVIPSGFTAAYDYLLIGGGGAGSGDQTGTSAGGGGGGGGVLYTSSSSISSGSYSVSIGAGGTPTTTIGNQGGSTTFNSLTAYGGGAGPDSSGGQSAPTYSNYGGGGGGADEGAGAPATAQGNAGGNGSPSSNADGLPGGTGNNKAGGGGGGSDASTSSRGGAGGNGVDYSSIFGTTYGENGYFAGGGGGGAYTNTPGTGGLGGAGDGSNENDTGGNGTPNTGGGGGSSGSSDANNNLGGAGGSGIVLIRYDISSL